MSTNARVILASLIALLTTAIVVACAATPDPTEVTNIYVSSKAFSDFAGVPTAAPPEIGVIGFITYRCGTLDCHGQIGRPFRLFSQNGIRLVDDAGNVSGGIGEGTTEAEIFADYTSAIGVQPELTSKVFAGYLDPHSLLLLRKPLGLERHKGGQVMSPGDNGDLCLSSWLTDGQEAGGVNFVACGKAAASP